MRKTRPDQIQGYTQKKLEIMAKHLFDPTRNKSSQNPQKNQ